MQLSEAELAVLYGPGSWCGRTLSEPLAQTTEKTLEPSLRKRSMSSVKRPPLFLSLNMDGLQPDACKSPTWEENAALRGAFSMPSFGESPSVDAESHLSQILEAHAPEKYYLSAKACRGILNRAQRRGKDLPPMLKTALHEMITFQEQRQETET